jgi:hypothetical protein
MLKIRDEDRELFEELDQFNPIKSNITCHAFVSRSKGLRTSGPRKGQQRLRGGYKEVTLVRYYKRFHSLHRAPLDEWVTEIFQGIKETTGDMDADYLKEEIKREFEL